MNDVQYAGGTVINGTRDFTNQAWLYAQEWGPRIIGALVILLIGWLVARAVKWGVANLLNKTPLARRANQPNHPPRDKSTIGAQVGDAAFWVPSQGSFAWDTSCFRRIRQENGRRFFPNACSFGRPACTARVAVASEQFINCSTDESCSRCNTTRWSSSPCPG